jgi:hypothetical protein
MTCLTPRCATTVALVSLALVQGACADLPTGPDSFQLEADGELWTAVVPPADLPSASTWLAFAAPSSPESADAASEVAALQASAVRAMTRGELERAEELAARATLRAIDAMQLRPGPGVFLAGIGSLQGWERRVREGVDLTRAPALAATLAEVGAEREAVDAALRAGDQRAAAIHLTRAAELVRAWSPQGVALRVLGRVDAHLAAASRSPGEAERAAHLVQSAREELLSGEPLRAVQRALYALQLAGGSELHEIPAEEHPSCGEYSC